MLIAVGRANEAGVRPERPWGLALLFITPWESGHRPLQCPRLFGLCIGVLQHLRSAPVQQGMRMTAPHGMTMGRVRTTAQAKLCTLLQYILQPRTGEREPSYVVPRPSQLGNGVADRRRSRP